MSTAAKSRPAYGGAKQFSPAFVPPMGSTQYLIGSRGYVKQAQGGGWLCLNDGWKELHGASHASGPEVSGLTKFFIDEIAKRITGLGNPYLFVGELDPLDYRSLPLSPTRSIKVKLKFRGVMPPNSYPDD